jgi:hypothetical protein
LKPRLRSWMCSSPIPSLSEISRGLSASPSNKQAKAANFRSWLLGAGIFSPGFGTSILASSRSSPVTFPRLVSIPSRTERWLLTKSLVLQTKWATSPARVLSTRTTLRRELDATAFAAM